MIEDDIIVVAWVLSLLIGIGLLQEGNIIFGIIFLLIFASPIVYFIKMICSD